MGKQIAVCKFCAKRGRMRYDGFCSAKCASDAQHKRSGPEEVARLIREADARRKKGKK